MTEKAVQTKAKLEDAITTAIANSATRVKWPANIGVRRMNNIVRQKPTIHERITKKEQIAKLTAENDRLRTENTELSNALRRADIKLEEARVPRDWLRGRE